MYREGVRGQRQRQRNEPPSVRARERRPRYRVTARLDARAHRIKHRSGATVRARSSMEKSSLLFVSPSFAPRRSTRLYRSDRAGRGSRRGLPDRLYILSRVDGGLYDASSRPHAHVRWGSIPALARSRPCSQRLPPTPRQPAHERRDPHLARAQTAAETERSECVYVTRR